MKNEKKYNLGDKILEVEIDKKTYQKKLIAVYLTLQILLLGSIVYLNIVSDSWAVGIVSTIIFALCVVGCIYNSFYSIKNIRMRIYQNYVVLGNHNFKEYLNLSDLKNYNIYQPIIDKLLKNDNYAISFYFANNNYKRNYVFNIKTDKTILDEKLNYAKTICTEKSYLQEVEERKALKNKTKI